jgi:hypothetical protein
MLGAVIAALAGITVTVVQTNRPDSRDPSDEIDRGVIATEYPKIVPALCDSESALRAGNLTRAYNAFWGTAHRGLHVLVADLEQRGERDRSGVILRAKNRVEGSIVAGGPSAANAVAELRKATVPALATVGVPVTACEP